MKKFKTSKKCNRCGKVKHVDEYYKSYSTFDGYGIKCKECCTLEAKKRNDRIRNDRIRFF